MKGRPTKQQLLGRRRSGRESLGRGDVFREKGVGRVPGKDEAENGRPWKEERRSEERLVLPGLVWHGKYH